MLAIKLLIDLSHVYDRVYGVWKWIVKCIMKSIKVYNRVQIKYMKVYNRVYECVLDSTLL